MPALTGFVARSPQLVQLRRVVNDARNLLLVGDAGVGKSYMARALTADLERDGWYVRSIAGSPGIKALHLGAVQTLASPGMARTPDELFGNIELELHRQAGEKPTALFVDDIDLVDPASAALLHQLARTNIVAIATVRSEAASEPAVLALWKGNLFHRVEVSAFDQATSAKFVEAALGGPATNELKQALFHLATGNALFTRELIADGLQTGSVVSSGDGWMLTGALRPAQRVSDLFAARLRALPDDIRDHLETVALGELLTMPIAEELVGRNGLEALEADDLIVVADGVIRPSHPMLGEVVRHEIPSLRKERKIGELIIALVGSPSATPGDVLRAARWQIERNETIEPELATVAAQSALAMFDGSTAVACAEFALDPTSSESHVLLGRALLIAQRPTEALTVLEQARQLAKDDAEIAAAAVALADTLIIAAGDFVQASQVLEATIDTLTEAPPRAMVLGSLSFASALMGNMRGALQHSDEAIESPEIDDVTRLHLLVMWTIAAALSGSIDRAHERTDQALALASTYRQVLPAAVDQILVTQVVLDLYNGRSAKAAKLAIEQRALAERERRITPLWDSTLSQVATLLGKGQFGCEAAAAAAAGLENFDPLGLRALNLASYAVALACTGDLAKAMSMHDLAMADPRCGPREQASLGRARSNVLALEGDLEGAVDAAVDGATKAGDIFVWASTALYDAVRFNRPSDVADQLQAMAAQAPVESVLAMNAHCEALIAGSAFQLTKVSDRFANSGYLLFAAEASAHASVHFNLDGDITASTVAALRAFVLFGQCDSMRSIAVEQLTNPLTKREFDIAGAAADGEPSQSIANRLFVTRRTVDNHLQNAYRKLGFNQRSQLQPVFAVEPSPL